MRYAHCLGYMNGPLCVCVCVCVCARARARAFVHLCARVCVCVCMPACLAAFVADNSVWGTKRTRSGVYDQCMAIYL